MDTTSQARAIGPAPLTSDERARFFVATRFGDLDCLTATFRRHCYAPHVHDTYVIGCITEGCEAFRVAGVQCYAGPADICFVNPEEVHDGAPHGAGYSYRMTYPSVALMQRIAAEMTGKPVDAVPCFPRTTVEDREAVAKFAAAHRAIEDGTDPLMGEELLYRAYAHCLEHHARFLPSAPGREAGAVARVKTMLNERYADDLGLAALAAEARLSPHQLIRAFRRETGMTPHAFLLSRRVQAARTRLRRNERVADVAAATGFADQAHLTRVFKARVGAPPGAYRTAIAQ